MSEAKDIAVGLTGGAVLTAATNAAGMSPLEPLLIGGGAGLLLAVISPSKAGGLALFASSVAGAAFLASRGARRRRLA
jgi:hypothetical protein